MKCNHSPSELKLAGIYRILNTVTDKCYIGSSINFGRRFKEHVKKLTKGNHSSIKLQRSVFKYGIENFIFEIVEIVSDLSTLIAVEQNYLDKYNAVEFGYNVSGLAHTIEINDLVRSRMSEAKKGKSMTVAQKEALTPYYESLKGKTRDPEIGRKISETRKSRNYPNQKLAVEKFLKENPDHIKNLNLAGATYGDSLRAFDENTLKSLVKDYISMPIPSVIELGKKYNVSYSTIAKIFKRNKTSKLPSKYSEFLTKIGFEGDSIKDLRRPEIQAKLILN